MAAFLGVFLVPSGLHLAGQPAWLAFLCGLPLALAVAWLTSSRILTTIQRVWTTVDRLNAATAGRRAAQPAHHDELSELVHNLDRLVRNLECTFQEHMEEVSETRRLRLASSPMPRQVYPATLASGAAVVGEVKVLPRREAEDLVVAARLVGEPALRVYGEATGRVRDQLEALKDGGLLPPDQQGIVDFQILLLEDDSLVSGLRGCLDDGLSLPESLNAAFAMICGRLESSPNAYLRARVADCLDLKQRLLGGVASVVNPSRRDLYAGMRDRIAACQQVFPSDVIQLREAGVRGIVSEVGTASSHAEIMLQSFNLPSVMNLAGLKVERLHGQTVMLDPGHRRLIVSPAAEDLDALERTPPLAAHPVCTGPAALATGQLVALHATINNAEVEVEPAVRLGAEGVGLFRSEMSYIGRQTLPGEDDLYHEYLRVTAAFRGKPITLRMLDLGSDKLPVLYPGTREDNPCMGNRSMRLLLREPAIFRTQLRAMLRAATPESCILYPMISGWYELEHIRRLDDQVREELRADGVPFCSDVQYGLMVEVPGLVERFEDYVREFAVFNIGANDLTQYALAADRNNEAVADYFKYYHPAVLSMFAKVLRVGRTYGKLVRICGEVSADLELLPLLVGLGARCLSVPCRSLVEVREALGRLDLGACERLAQEALAATSTRGVEAALAASRARQAAAAPEPMAASH